MLRTVGTSQHAENILIAVREGEREGEREADRGCLAWPTLLALLTQN